MRLSTLTAVSAALLLATAAAAAPRPDAYPLKAGSVGPRVCAAQWLLQGGKPSVYQNAWFRVRKADPAPRKDGGGCEFGIATKRQIETLRWRLGQPKPITGTWTLYLQEILVGKKARPSRWVALATARRTSGSVLLKAYPTSEKRTLIGRPFQGTHSLGNYQSDNAVDIPCTSGTPIRAPIKGRLFGGYGRLSLGGSRFAGYRINLTGLYRARAVNFYMAHMATLTVQPFSFVEAGQKIGTCGSANGVYHVHIGASYRFPIVDFVEGGY